MTEIEAVTMETRGKRRNINQVPLTEFADWLSGMRKKEFE